MPKGSDAPGKVLPPPDVPMMGSTASYAAEADCAWAEMPASNESRARPKRSAERCRMEGVLSRRCSQPELHTSIGEIIPDLRRIGAGAAVRGAGGCAPASVG